MVLEEAPLSPRYLLAVLLLGGLLFTLMAFWQLDRAGDAASWHTTQGWVESSRVRHETRHDGATVHHEYIPAIRYRYQVGGREYHSTRLAPSDLGQRGYTSESRAVADVETWPEGTPVTVHYDPNHPATAALQVSAGTGWWYLGLGVVLMGVGALGMGITFRE